MKKELRFILLLVAIYPSIAFSQEEPEAKFITGRNQFVDSVPYALVNADKPQWKISKYLTGQHFVYANEPDSLYADERISQFMRDSKTGTIRWPGGTVVQFYHWDHLTGIPFSNDSWDPNYNGEKRSGEKFMDLDEYIAFCRKVNADPMVGVNIKSGRQYNRVAESLDEAKRLITYCKQKNYHVKFWYIGNEGYAKGISYKEYTKDIDAYAEVLKSVDPNITIIGDWKFGPLKKNRFEEALYIAKNSKHLNVLEFHEKWGVIWGLKTGHTVPQWQQETPLYDGRLGMYIQRFKDEMRKANKDVKISFNEWGLGTIDGGNKFDYAMVAADYLMEMFKNDVYQTCYWNLNAGERLSRVFDTNAEGTQILQLNPISKIFTLYADALQKDYLYLDCNEKSIYGFGAKDPKAGKVYLYLLNKSVKDSALKLGIFGLASKNADLKIERFVKPGIIITENLKAVDIKEKELVLKASSFTKITINTIN
ncbi:hypothetical protein I5M32_13865 [Pedobacter sp. SD-b]|uniref:Alpha-L-arabinofuranosidase 1 catalytic domain-containing protein n=1 Tax=Pedobacter segetis TaxID=2793069 RepID=A0ABS1BMT4_9SPHI|nr:hypothetical protein [Pedobacter segetis]MBK0384051.1 hypothetical protein [Pedobacter segetis]